MCGLMNRGIKGEAVKTMFEEAGLFLSTEQRASFSFFVRSLLGEGVRLGVTGVKTHYDIWRKHILDSLLLFKATEVEEFSRMVDIGSGAGIPGIALKIYRLDLHVTLIEAQNRRISFMQSLIHGLGLKGVHCLWGRAEDLGRKPELREAYDLVVARAVAPMAVLAEYCLPFARLGGKFVAYKGPAVDEEIRVGEKALKLLGGEVVSVWRSTLPGGEGENRSLVIVRKCRPTPEIYPRRPGVPAKRPLF